MEKYFFDYLIDQLNKGNFNEVALKTKKNFNKYKHLPIFWNLRGIAMQNLNYTVESVECFVNSHKLDKKNVAPLFNISKIYLEKKMFSESIEFAKKCLTINEKHTPSIIVLANALSSSGDYKQSIFYCDLLLNNFESKIPRSYVYNLKGANFELMGNSDNSLVCYKKALVEDKSFLPAEENIANVYSSKGEIEVAIQMYKKILQKDPENCEIHRRLSIIKKYQKVDDEHILLMEKIFSKKNLDENKLENLGYALSKSKEDVKDYKKAFEYFSISNSIRDKKTNYNYEFQEKEHNCLKEIFLNIDYKTIHKNSFHEKKNQVIFILGMPRSGTTLIEQIISSHPAVQGLEEIDFLSKSLNQSIKHTSLEEFSNKIRENSDVIFKKIEKLYFDQISNSKDPKFLIHTDKMPVNYKLIGFIKMSMPYAKVIHCVRQPKDVFVSIIKNYFSQLNMSYAYSPRKLVHYQNLYVKYMRMWKNYYGDWIYDVNYEDLVERPDCEIKKLLNFCDLDFHKDCIDFQKNKKSVSTASSFQVRQPIYKSSSSAWKNYEMFFKDYFDQLEIY